MTARVNAFADLSAPPVFEPKPRRENPVSAENMERLAEDNNFVSRQAPKLAREPKKKRRVYKTGRNRSSTSKLQPRRLSASSRWPMKNICRQARFSTLHSMLWRGQGARPQADTGLPPANSGVRGTGIRDWSNRQR